MKLSIKMNEQPIFVDSTQTVIEPIVSFKVNQSTQTEDKDQVSNIFAEDGLGAGNYSIVEEGAPVKTRIKKEMDNNVIDFSIHPSTSNVDSSERLEIHKTRCIFQQKSEEEKDCVVMRYPKYGIHFEDDGQLKSQFCGIEDDSLTSTHDDLANTNAVDDDLGSLNTTERGERNIVDNEPPKKISGRIPSDCSEVNEVKIEIGERFQSKNELTDSPGPSVVKCSTSSAVLKSKEQLKNLKFRSVHFQNEDQCEYVRCQDTLYSFVRVVRNPRPEELEQFVKAETVDGKDLFVCIKCGRASDGKGEAFVHLRKEHFYSGYQCTLCKNIFTTKHNMHYHAQSHHLKNVTFSCSICQRQLSTESSLKVHMTIHDSKRERFPCKLCDKSYLSKRALNQHVKVTHIKSRFVCLVCTRSFPSKSHLNEHKITHNVLNHFLCTVCGATFKSRYNLYYHKANKCPALFCQ